MNQGLFEQGLLPIYLLGVLTGILICALIFLVAYKKGFRPQVSASRSGLADLTTVVDNITERHKLTQREREILILLYEGYTNPAIAEHLNIAMNTVKGHVHHIFEKLGVNSRIDLVHMINSEK